MEQSSKNIESIPVLKISQADRSREAATVAREFMLTIFLNGQELVTIMCSLERMKELAVGFLFSEGLIRSKEAIKTLEVDEWIGTARIQSL